jgi:UDP-N-acetylmuramyl pentapeptide phosphotransferase/UDP-N-acetylglucosamine-1-phosphate transferase
MPARTVAPRATSECIIAMLKGKHCFAIAVSAPAGAAVYFVARWQQQTVVIGAILAILTAIAIRMWISVVQLSQVRGKPRNVERRTARGGGGMLLLWGVLVLSFLVAWNLVRILAR